MLFGKHIRHRLSQISTFLILIMVANVLAVTADWYYPSREAKAAGKMMLFFDGASIPNGWTEISSSGKTFYQKFIRGDSTFNQVLDFDASDTHDHTVNWYSSSAAVGNTFAQNTSGSAIASDTHTHDSLGSSSMDSATSLPPYRELQVIECDAGVPTTLPASVIAMFATTVPASGWTRYSAQDDKFIRGGPDGESTGGNADHFHGGVQITTGGPSSSPGASGIQMSVGGTSSHTHSEGVSGTTNTVDHAPPNVDILLYKADSSVSSIPDGLIAMFTDASPGDNWTVISEDGQEFYQKYLEAKSSYNASGGGTDTHDHINLAIATGGPSATSALGFLGAIGVVDDTLGGHFHTITVSFGDAYNRPLYVDTIIARYDASYTPETENWRWFDAEDTADPNNTNGGDTTTGDAMANEDTTPTNTRIVYVRNAMKLRMVIGETAGAGGTDVKFKLQYDTSTDFLSPTDVATSGDTSKAWRYYDGDNVDDDDVISTTRLSGSPSAGRHNEDAETGIGEGSTFDPSASTDYEHEFTIQLYSLSASLLYYFRVQYYENSQSPGRWVTVALGSGEAYPGIRCAGGSDLEVSQAPATVQLGSYTWGGSGTLTYPFVASEEIVFWDKRGTGVAYDATVSSMSMSSGGDTIPGADITWTSTTGVLYGSFASDTTGFTGNTGETLDVNRDAYQAGTTTLPEQTRRGGFYFLPTMAFGNLNSRDTGNYTGTLTLTVI